MTYGDLILVILGLVFVILAGVSSFRYVSRAANRGRAVLTCMVSGVVLVVVALLVPMGLMPGSIAMGMFVGSVLGLIPSPKTRTETQEAPARTQDTAGTKKCPMCAEFIKEDALACKHCGHRFSEEEVERARQTLAAEQTERAAAAEAERQRAILEAERSAVTLSRKKAKFRRTVAWILITTAVLLNMLAVLGAVAGAKTGHPILEGLTAFVIGVLILFIPLGLPAVFLLRSARRLSRKMQTSANAEPSGGANAG